MNTYTDQKITENIKYRIFDQNIDEHELVWHRDLEDRSITVIEGQGWYFQMDNQLPVELKQNTTIFIPKMEYHRVIKGTSTLRVQIEE